MTCTQVLQVVGMWSNDEKALEDVKERLNIEKVTADKDVCKRLVFIDNNNNH